MAKTLPEKPEANAEACLGFLRILVVEDNPADAELCLRELRRAGWEVAAQVVQTAEECAQCLRAQTYDIVLADYGLPNWSGLGALELMRAQGTDTPVILVTGSLGDEKAVECIKQGATDYVLKDNLVRLPLAIRHALEEKALRAERRRAEAERIRLMTAIEQAAEAVVITDPEGKIEYVNPAFTWMTGYARPEAQGRHLLLPKSGVGDELSCRMMWETLRAGKVWQGELINRRKDGSLYTEEMSITPVRGADGQITHFIALKQDITERKRAQEEHVHALHLQAENEALTRANQMKSEFLTDMSHELRSPLNSILGFSELLLENAAGLTPEQREDLAIVHRKAEHLLALVNDLLDLSRIEAGQVELERTAIPVREYLVSVLDAFAVHLREKNLQAKVEVEPPDLQVYADARRLEEILTNLTVNALRYTERGGLVLRAWGRRGHVLFSVEDTGIGIAPQDQERVFNKFYQARQQAEGGKEGTGLGLAITLRLVELHGGRIWLESAPGQGTRFFFTLPNAFPPGRLSPRQANG